MKKMGKRIISAAIMIMAIGVILFSEREEGRLIEVNINLGQEINQALEENKHNLVIKKDEQERKKEVDREMNVEQVTQITMENSPQSIEEVEQGNGQLEEAEVIELPKMDWALFLETEVGVGVAAGNFYWRHGIYGDFTSSQREGEEVYFSLNEKILGMRLELTSTLKRKEAEENYENNHHTAWRKNGEERIVGCSPDLEWMISWQSEDGIERWYINGKKIKETDISWGRKNFISQREGNSFVPLEEGLIIEAEEYLGELYETEVYSYSIDYRTMYRFSSNGPVFAAANRTESDEPDAINIYSLRGEEPILVHELPIPTDEMKWPIQIWQVEGDEHSGWVVFSYGYETFRSTYPEGNIEKLGEYMFAASYSPDEKFLAYCTGNEVMWDYWMNAMGADVGEEIFLERCYLIKAEMEKIPQGWYVIDLETNKKSYIPVPVWTYDEKPLYGGHCTWIEKDKLMEMLEK